jgi:hypothetical protein
MQKVAEYGEKPLEEYFPKPAAEGEKKAAIITLSYLFFQHAFPECDDLSPNGTS